jgi:predicted Rossmann fold flavoprotein
MQNITENYFDVIVVGGGAAGLIASITSARNGKKVLLLEKLSDVASKLKATGGGKCNLTNTLSNEEFISRFGRDGRFMTHALERFNYQDLIKFFSEIGVDTHTLDGYRVFPVSHNSKSVIDGLKQEIDKLNIKLITSSKVDAIKYDNAHISGVSTAEINYYAPKVIIATGGLGYPTLGATGDGLQMAKACGHKITDLHPAMMPLHTKEDWVNNCRADTIPKVTIKVDMLKHTNLRAIGDLIFTTHGIRGPVVLDFAREITPLLDKYGEVPILINLTKGMNEEQIRTHISKNSSKTILETISELLPISVATELIKMAEINESEKCSKVAGLARDNLIKLLVWTPLTITGHDGFKMAMITRGGVSLREIDPRTMESKIIKGLYFCGEVVDLDGPCGGYNLQWSFASGYLAGQN